MTAATRYKDKPHARLYAEWLRLPSWRNLSPHARALLVEMLASYRPGMNGYLEWPQSKVAALLWCGNVKAAETLVELEKAGWVEVTRAGSFTGLRPATHYRLTLHPCAATGDPASHAYLSAFLPPRKVRKRNPTGANGKPTGFHQSSQRVPSGSGESNEATPLRASDALRKALMKQGLIAKGAPR